MYRGKVMERGPVEQIFHAPAESLHAHADRLRARSSRRRPQIRLARPPLRPTTQPPVLEVREPQDALSAAPRPVKAVDDVSLTSARRDARHRRRERLGQDDAGPLPAARLRSDRAARSTTAAPTAASSTSPRPTRRRCSACRREIRMIFQDPFASLNPRMTVAQIIGEPLLVNGIARAPSCEDRVARAHAAGRPRAGLARALPARLLRRPAPAHRHRPRDRAEAAADRRRRGDLGARRLAARADARPAAASCRTSSASPMSSSATTSR